MGVRLRMDDVIDDIHEIQLRLLFRCCFTRGSLLPILLEGRIARLQS